MAFPPESIIPIVQEISQILISRNETISVSEGACGGLLSAYLVSLQGASDWFQGGTLLYSLNSRLKLSGWSRTDIDNYTGPSEKVALRLARNLRIELGSTYVLSETGIASEAVHKRKEFAGAIGTVYLGISTPNGEISKVTNTGNEDRQINMQEFAKLGLEFFLEELKKIVENENKVIEEEENGAKRSKS
ncbi:hypothetical protein WICMUC_004233 [Wickerhamomyces mucosus]|uniref:CinA C-terminal domain-containing protein n=1 Tax=Wickerhamomyces mucosus TaxID=1378264 RepID=A0A9P8PIE7_9ASCO|nr:hypothetical protein WICMUC_004233 [Wickerhamomyces mucosus]